MREARIQELLQAADGEAPVMSPDLPDVTWLKRRSRRRTIQRVSAGLVLLTLAATAGGGSLLRLSREEVRREPSRATAEQDETTTATLSTDIDSLQHRVAALVDEVESLQGDLSRGPAVETPQLLRSRSSWTRTRDEQSLIRFAHARRLEIEFGEVVEARARYQSLVSNDPQSSGGRVARRRLDEMP